MIRNGASPKPARPSWRALAVVFLTTATLWAADGKFEKSYDSTREPRVSLNNVKGRILVRGWDKAEVHLVYTLASPRLEVDSEILPETGPADKIRLETHLLDPSLASDNQVADYILDVPVATTLEIRNPQGKIIVQGMQADASLQSVGADISIRDYVGRLLVHSVAGDIEVIHPSGSVEAYTVTGNLHFVSPSTSRLHGSTTSGSIIFEGDFLDRGDYILSAYSGNLDVICPASSSFELTAKTLKGKVVNTLPMTHRRESASHGTASSLLGMHNAGRANVELTSFSGNIHIRPQD